MNNLKRTLRIITICCAILPLLFTVLVYQENLIGLLVPPQITAAILGKDQAIQELLPDFNTLSNVEPTFNNDFQFNPEDGTYHFSINLISPLPTPITFDSLSVTVTDENGTLFGSVNLGNPVTFVPDKNSTIPLEGTLSQEFITLLQNSDLDPADPNFNPENIEEIDLELSNIHLTNLNTDIGGIQIHTDDLNLSELFGFQESESTEGE